MICLENETNIGIVIFTKYSALLPQTLAKHFTNSLMSPEQHNKDL